MASESEHKRALRAAIQRTTSRNRIILSQEAIDFFVDRAITHIYQRALTPSNRDLEVSKAEGTAGRLIGNLMTDVRKTTGAISLDESNRYISRSAACFYPWCKP